MCEAYQYEMFPPNSLYHTTSPGAAFNILEDRQLQPQRDGFVSLSEKPHLHDIQAHGAVIVFDSRKLYAQLEPVEYSETWAKTHADQARYIAGEGWQEQFEYTSDDDEDEFDADDNYDHAYADAELEAFLQKAAEDEWISLEPGVPVQFTPDAVIGLIVDAMDDADRQALVALGYAHVMVRSQ